MSYCDYDYEIEDYTIEKKIADKVPRCLECCKKIRIGEEYTEHSYFEEGIYSVHATHTICHEASVYMREKNICLAFGEMMYIENDEGEKIFIALKNSDVFFRDKFANPILEKMNKKNKVKKGETK